MKKILWLSNLPFSDQRIDKTASWLQPLMDKLHRNKSFKFQNITFGSANQVVRKDYDGIDQWIIPLNRKDKYNQIASLETCKTVASIINQEKPDLVHIWGTESVWASVYRQGYIKQTTLIDIQGLLFVYADFYYGGLTFTELLQSIHIKEVLMPWRTLFAKKKVFEKRGTEEVLCLKSLQHISYPSEWVKSHISLIQPNAIFYPKPFMLRDEFFESSSWKYKEPLEDPIIFSSCSAAVTYKGMHVLIKAISLLKKKYPKIKLRLAGKINVGNRLLDGYSVFLNRLIRKYNLINNVQFVGSLTANQIIEELLNCNVFVMPSFIETYCLAFAEAMIIGTPVVVSFAGAMPELAEHGKEALFYNPNDVGICATYIDDLIQNRELAERLSHNARERRLRECNQDNIVKAHFDTYNSLINEFN
jgi:glycosyltransferase involved in cell wall biosynthesis